MIYKIKVCPVCLAGPIEFPDRDPEGMTLRTYCENKHLVLQTAVKTIYVS